MEANNIEQLKEDCARVKEKDFRQEMILENIPLVAWLARRFVKMQYDAEYDDLFGCGVIGLIKAVDDFQNAKGVKFSTFAVRYIRVEMLKLLSKTSWVPIASRKRNNKITDAVYELEIKNGRAPTDDEIMEYVGISKIMLSNWKRYGYKSNVVSLDKYLECVNGNGAVRYTEIVSEIEEPYHVAERNELRQTIARVLESLTNREREVIVLYYCNELAFKEISDVLGISNKRVYQLHKCALQKMQKGMIKHKNLLS